MKNKHEIHTVAILGFGVVGGGVAKLITDNKEELISALGAEVRIAHILDLRDFPDSPFASIVTHDYQDIVSDPEVDTVIEVMGGSHPAYEYTIKALSAGKNVITSNKEVVANFGDEFIALARKMGVSYRFEAAVGGGIPVINPLTSCIRQNKIREVRGILNGTTNYILTKMFTYGDSFENALADAQEKGYAERNPDADILGTDACRKITILTALASDMLIDVSKVKTEGITGIRAADVTRAEEMGHKIKLLGRCVIGEDGPKVIVAPYLIPSDSPLAGVNGVFNAIEVVAEPLGNVMFYGPGAGAGATASAVVGDLLPILSAGKGNHNLPNITRSNYDPEKGVRGLVSKSYVALPLGSSDKVKDVFDRVKFIEAEGECVFITPELTEEEFDEKMAQLGRPILSRIRFL